MRININPFYSRASEAIGLDDRFIKLFSADILDIFNDRQIWDIVNIFRSSPGGGKTTLLRLFTPEILLNIKEKSKQKDEQSIEIFKRLASLNAYDEKGNPIVIGTLIPFTSEYSTLEYLTIEKAEKVRLFFALLNVRIVLSVLHSICAIKKIKFPDDLDKISIHQNPSKVGFNPLRNISDGKKIYDWCCSAEETISTEIDSIYLTTNDQEDKSNDLYSLQLLNPEYIKIEGQPITERILIMLDDVHNLSSNQREILMKSIVDKRPIVNVWLSERLRALSMEEIISEGNIANRDFNIITLEQFWNSKYDKFEKFTKSVAQKRLSTIIEGESTNFATYLSEEFDPESLQNWGKSLVELKKDIKEKFGRDSKYQKWIQSREEFDGDTVEQLIEWKSLEILLYRDSGKQQQTFAFDDVLNEDELEQQDGTDVKEAARLFLHKDSSLPYYYGISKVSRLSSCNIEQFLTISGKLFEVIVINHLKRISKSTSTTGINIAPKRQENAIKKLCDEKWKELDIRVPSAKEIKIFLDHIGEFCREQTYTKNAWNSPGINGIAITMHERNLLKEKALNDPSNEYHTLAKYIATCIAYNLIDFKLDYKCKGKLFMILYLNRLYCVKYKLPLNNGKFKERKLADLTKWATNNVTAYSNLKLNL